VSCKSTARNRLAFFGVPREIEPEARHVKPMDVTFRAACFMRECEVLLCVLSEFFRDCHGPPLMPQKRDQLSLCVIGTLIWSI
jgi:hypothetical protein